MKTFDITKHFSELDRSVLVGENAYNKYFQHVELVFDTFLSALEDLEHDEPFEHDIIELYARRILKTISLFKIKFIENLNQPMLVDVTESGYPNSIEIKRLKADIEFAVAYLQKTEKSSRLKQDVLEHLIKEQSEPEQLLHDTGMRMYYERLLDRGFFMSFNVGEFKQLEHKDDTKNRYLYHWATFDDVLNRPFIYILVFDYLKSDKKISTKPIIDTIVKRTLNTGPLKIVASDIDRDLPELQPKILKRIDLGPIYNHFARDEHDLTKLIQTQFGEEDFIFEFSTEIIFSVGEQTSSNFITKDEIYQIFHVDDSNMECMQRMISAYKKYMITSHRVWQYLQSNYKEKISDLAAPPYIYKNK